MDMDAGVRILHLEDNRNDSNLLEALLDEAGLRCELIRIETRGEYAGWLDTGGFDLIVSDYTLPSFDGGEALRMARERRPEIPFIFFSGTMGEDNAVQALLGGATDYVLKTDPKRLSAAVRRALREASQGAELRAAARAVAESEEKFRALTHTAVDAIITADEQGRITYLNPAAEKLFGWSGSELMGRPLSGIIPERYPRRQAAGSQPRVIGRTVELSGLRRDGAEFPLELSLSEWAAGGGRSFAAIIRDISARRQAEQALRDTEAQLRQAQKMEAIGRLAGGVAHDFNNLLTAIMGLADLCLLELPPESPLRVDLSEIKSTALRAAALTRQLLAFSRKQVIQPRPVDLSELVAGLERMLRRVIEEDIALELRPAPRPAVAFIDPIQVEQLVLNLAVNARDAMPGGGKLTLSLGHAALDAVFCGSRPGSRPGDYVLLSIADTGTGMTAEVKAHLFEPFFTTKEPGKGTGLGLATCLGIVKQNGGWIGAESAPGRGARFDIYLPAHGGRAVPVGPPAPTAGSLRGAEVLLLAEDEPAVRRLAARALRGQGYRVLEAADADEALRRVAEDLTREIRLLIADAIMPGEGGRRLAQRVRELRPDIRPLFVSGYADESMSRQGVLPADLDFLAKPFAPAQLLAKVREILDR